MSKWITGLVLMGACVEDPDPGTTEPGTTDPLDVADLADFGELPVGHQIIDITYQPAGRSEPRTIPVSVWYPSVPGGPSQTYAAAGFVEFDAPLATRAVPAEGDDVWPVAVYSHGSGGVDVVGYPYGEHLASHGWVVVSPDHKGNRALDLFLGPADPFAQSAVDRPQDVSAALDWLEGSVDNPLEGRVDTSAVLMIGHSFGGYTTFAKAGAFPSVERLSAGCPNEDNPSCPLFDNKDFVDAIEAGFEDSRIVAIVPQAPAIGFFEPSEITGVSVPTLLQTGRLDATTTNETSAIPAWNAMDGADDVWLEMPTGGHLTFLSICQDLTNETIKTFQPSAFDDGCGDAFIPVTEALPVLRSYIRAMGNAYVLGEEDWIDAITESQVPDGFLLTEMETATAE